MAAARQGLIVSPWQQAEPIHPRSEAMLAPDSEPWCFSFVVGLTPSNPPPRLLNKKLEADAKKWEPVLLLSSPSCVQHRQRDRHLGQDLQGAGH